MTAFGLALFFLNLKVLLLNRANHLLGIYPLSKGGVSGIIVDLKLLLASAIKAKASALILAHNSLLQFKVQ